MNDEHAGGAGLGPAGAPRASRESAAKKEGAHEGTMGSLMLYQPRVSSRSSGASAAAERPLIASPSPCETRASTSASR